MWLRFEIEIKLVIVFGLILLSICLMKEVLNFGKLIVLVFLFEIWLGLIFIGLVELKSFIIFLLFLGML